MSNTETVAQIIERNRIAAQKTGAPVLGETSNTANRRAAAKSAWKKHSHAIAKEPKNEDDFSAAKLAGGIATKGIDSAMSGLTSTADWLVGQNITGLGNLLGQDWSNNPVSALNRRVQQAKETNQAYFQPNVEQGGKAAEIVDKYGTATVAAVPQALTAVATAGMSTAGTAGLQAASAAAQSSGAIAAARGMVQSLAKDPQYWLAFSQVAGDSYQQAKADGAGETAANLYAMGNGLLNAAIEVGGGIQTLPKELQKGGSALKAWVDSMVDEGKEEVAQGIMERGLQNLMYQKKNPLASVKDENAVLNPRTAAEEFAGGAVVGGILGGGQTLINRAANAPNVKLTKDGIKLEGAQKSTAPILETVSFDDPKAADGKGAVSLLRESVRDMVGVEPVANISGTEISSEGRATDRVMDFVKSLKDKVIRPNFGEVLFSKSKVKNSLVGHGSGEAKIELFAAVPAVIQQGKQIAHRTNWKGRGYDSFVFAAPVTYRGETTYVTAIVVRDNANRYYLHEAVDQYGNLIYGHEKSPDIASDGSGVSPKSTVADTELSPFSISRSDENSKGDFSANVDEETVRNIRNSNLPTAMQDKLIQANQQVAREKARKAAERESAKEIEVPELEPAEQRVPQNLAQEGKSAALERLGVHPVGDMADYTGVELLGGENQAKKNTAKERVRAEVRTMATKGEKRFAKGIAEGVYAAEDIPRSMNRETVLTLLDYYRAENSFPQKSGTQWRGAEIREKTEQMAEKYFKDEASYKPISMLVMNERTPERVMRSIFGDEQGAKINEAYIYPVQQNEAEKLRFIQRQLDQVRTFEGSDGKRSRLTKEERSIVQQVMEDRFVGETVASMEMSAAIRNAAENIGKGADPADAGREFSLNADEKRLAQSLERWTRNQKALDSGKLDSKKINNAVEKFSEQYDLFYNAVNDFLTAHGYERIGFIKGYAPHMQGADTQNKLLSALRSLGVNTDASSLPTSISGLTADYKPGKRWNPFFQSRKGEITEYDVSKGYESYVSYLGDILYHTDDIARLRGVSRYLRKTFGPEEINHAIDHAESLRDADLHTQTEVLKEARKISEGTKLDYADARTMMNAYVDELYDNISKTTKYGEFVKYIDNYANLLAGKQSMADRGMEYMAGRTSLNAGNKLVSLFGRAQVAGNISSVLNQTAQIPQIMAEVKGKHIVQAVSDLTKASGGKPWNIKKTGIFDQSDLLTGKKGIEYLTADDSKWDQFVSAIFKPADIMDSTVSALAVQSKYNQLIAEGKVPEAARMESDRWATQVMASRMKGSRPMAFESKSVVNQLLHMFQVEASNSFEHLTQDIPARYRGISKQYGKKAASRAIAAVATKGLLSAFIINRVAEAVYGGTPAPFDLLGYLANFFASGEGLSTNEWLKSLVNNVWKKMFGEELLGDEEEGKKQPFNLGAAASDVLYNVSNDIPFVRNAAGILGVGDQTMPFTNMAEAAMGVKKALTTENRTGGEIAGSLLELGSTLLPGGRQLQKTAQGIQTMGQGGRAYGYGENQRMQYPVEQSPLKWGQAALFGNAGLSETRAFYASGDTGLTARQTKTVREMAASGSDLIKVYDTIQSLRRKNPETGEQPNTQTKLGRLNGASLTDDEKLRLYSEVIATSESKRPEEFRSLMQKGLKWRQVYEAYSMYLDLNKNDGMSAGEKATRFASWVDGQKLSKAQKSAILDSMAFYSQAKAEAKRYTAMTEAGLSSDAAERLALRISKLTPEAGKQNVSDLQRYNAVVNYGLTEPEQIAALESIMEDTEFEKLENAYNAGVSPAQFVAFKQKTDGFASDKVNGKTVSSKKSKVLNAINSMQLTNEQKTALYYAAGYKESTLSDAPWVGGGRRAGITMPRLSDATSRTTGTALDKYSLGKYSLDKYDIMPKLR